MNQNFLQYISLYNNLSLKIQCINSQSPPWGSQYKFMTLQSLKCRYLYLSHRYVANINILVTLNFKYLQSHLLKANLWKCSTSGNHSLKDISFHFCCLLMPCLFTNCLLNVRFQSQFLGMSLCFLYLNVHLRLHIHILTLNMI